MQRARYQEQRRADRWDNDNLTRRDREYYRERQRIKRRKEKRRRRIRSIVSLLEGIVLCLILISALNYLPVFGNQGKAGRLSDVFSERNGAEAGLIWGETETEPALEESEESLPETEAEETETEETKAEEIAVEEMTAEAEAGAYDFSRPVPLSEPVDNTTPCLSEIPGQRA